MQPLPLSTIADKECLCPLLGDVGMDVGQLWGLREQVLEGQRVDVAPGSSDLLQVAGGPKGQLLRQLGIFIVSTICYNTGVSTVSGSLLVYVAWAGELQHV